MNLPASLLTARTEPCRSAVSQRVHRACGPNAQNYPPIGCRQWRFQREAILRWLGVGESSQIPEEKFLAAATAATGAYRFAAPVVQREGGRDREKAILIHDIEGTGGSKCVERTETQLAGEVALFRCRDRFGAVGANFELLNFSVSPAISPNIVVDDYWELHITGAAAGAEIELAYTLNGGSIGYFTEGYADANGNFQDLQEVTSASLGYWTMSGT